MPGLRERAWIGLGANLGAARDTLEAAIVDMVALPGTALLRRSSFYRAAPVEAEGPTYVNAVVELETALDPLALLDALQAIESRHGRQRPYPNAPRTLDLDLLLYGQRQLQLARLTVPHPRLHRRAFVLVPMLEIDPDVRAPGVGVLAERLVELSTQAIERLP